MAITTIDTGTLVGLKAGADIYNANFTDATNAASHLVQASASDTTTDRVVTTEALGDNGGPIFTDFNYQPGTLEGIGVVHELQNNSGGNIATSQTVTGDLLNNYTKLSDGTIASSAALSVGDIYKNVGLGVADLRTSNFVRIS